MKPWSVYILRCADGSLYCGVTTDLESRILKHSQGTASKYTRSRLPVSLVAVQGNLEKVDAFKLEYRVKKLPAAQKLSALQKGDVRL